MVLCILYFMIQEKRENTSRAEEKKANKVVVDAADIRELVQNIGEMNDRLRKLNSLRHRFAVAVLQGFGVALGGTIVAYIVISILIETLRQVNYIPFINMMFDSEYFRIFVNRLTNLQTQLQ